MKNYKRQPHVFEWFNDTGFGLSRSHKVNNARYKIYQIFEKWYLSSVDFDLDSIVSDLNDALPELRFLLMDLHRTSSKKYSTALKRKTEFAFEPDRRRGWETYKFDKIEDDLSYISGKWYCEFRLQWIIDMIHYYNVQKAVTPTYPKG